MILIEFIIFGIALIIFTIFDFKINAVPSVFLTASLLIALAINPSNLVFGVLALLFGLLLYEFGYFSGMADLKITVMIGFLISNIYVLFAFFLAIMIYGILFKLIYKQKYKEKKECPFILVFLLTYLTIFIPTYII